MEDLRGEIAFDLGATVLIEFFSNFLDGFSPQVALEVSS